VARASTPSTLQCFSSLAARFTGSPITLYSSFAVAHGAEHDPSHGHRRADPGRVETRPAALLAPAAPAGEDLLDGEQRLPRVHRARPGGAEARQHPVARELVDAAAAAVYGGDHEGLVLRREPYHLGGRQALGEPREAPEIGEQDGGLPQLRLPGLERQVGVGDAVGDLGCEEPRELARGPPLERRLHRHLAGALHGQGEDGRRHRNRDDLVELRPHEDPVGGGVLDEIAGDRVRALFGERVARQHEPAERTAAPAQQDPARLEAERPERDQDQDVHQRRRLEAEGRGWSYWMWKLQMVGISTPTSTTTEAARKPAPRRRRGASQKRMPVQTV